MKKVMDKCILRTSAQVNTENYVFIMNRHTYKQLCKQLAEISGEYLKIVYYREYRIVVDNIVKDGEICFMNWKDYAREKDAFNLRIGLHL